MPAMTRQPVEYNRLIWGSTVLLTGIVCLLAQMGYISQRYLLDLWPALLIAGGLCVLVDRRRRSRANGLFLLLAGVLLLVGNLLPPGHTMEIRLGWLGFKLSWPLLLVAIGIYITGHDYFVSAPALEEKR